MAELKIPPSGDSAEVARQIRAAERVLEEQREVLRRLATGDAGESGEVRREETSSRK